MQNIEIEKASIVLIVKRERKDFVIGAPHHSLGGAKTLPCHSHPVADENTGLIVRMIADN